MQYNIPKIENGTAALFTGEALFRSLRNKLVGYWSTSVGESEEGILPDLSGYGNNGVTYGLTSVMSRYGRVLVGTNDGSNERIELQDQITVSVTGYTIWVHMKPTGNTARLFGSANGHAQYGMYETTTGMQIASSGGMEGAAFSIPAAGIWHQASITADKNGGVRYNIDGVLSTIDSGFSGTLTFDNIMNTTTADWAIDGQIRAVGIWERQLYESELEVLAVDPFAVERSMKHLSVCRIGFSGGAARGSSPRSNINGPLVGPLGGVI